MLSESVHIGTSFMAALRRVVLSGLSNSRLCLAKHRASNVHFSYDTSLQISRFNYRQISQLVKTNGKRAFLVDTLALVIVFFFFACDLAWSCRSATK